MDIRVSGHQVDVGDAFRSYVGDKLRQLAEKYFSRTLSAGVTLTREAHGHGFHVDCAMHVRQGVLLKAEGSNADPHIAFDIAADRIEKQLRRYKRRLKNHHNGAARELDVQPAAYTVIESHHEEDAPEHDNPVIVAETQTDIPQVSVSDAVMLMDLRHAPALMFRNAGNGRIAMVYRRGDGHIGWVEPTATPA
ncbi:ribosome hibernation-promoting factor, HPF/YfiA family [Parapedomonas caeni]|jgi:ribosomal subunit interface protein